jgi:hypothetical protein
MPDMIRDGSGGGLLAKVNENLRLYTEAVTTSNDAKATELGDSYNINTGLITLTNAAETPLIYIKNNGVEDLHINTIIIGTFASTGGTGTDGVPKAVFIRNPTTGTIISSTPTNVDINSNRNYGSAKTLSVDAYKGATNDTMTDGTDHIIVQMGTSGRVVVSIDEQLPRGSSFGIKYTPQGSNTNQQVYCAVLLCVT